MTFTLSDLQAYIIEAQAPHALGTAKVEKDEQDGSWVIRHSRSDWSFKDVFYGGRPYGGLETVYYKGKAVWTMVYYGNVYATKLNPDEVYDFLRKTLQSPDPDLPLRGPDHFTEGAFTYTNQASGTIDNFKGKETISENGVEIYSAEYIGGLVDQEEGAGF